jgi:tetratricopeptide (TPR) repeat protein
MSLIEKALKQAEKERRRRDVYWEILTLAFSPSSQKKSSRIFFFFFFLPFLGLIAYFSYMTWKYPPEFPKPLSLRSITVQQKLPSPAHQLEKGNHIPHLQKAASSPEEKIRTHSVSQTKKSELMREGAFQPEVKELKKAFPAQQIPATLPETPALAQLHFEKGKKSLSEGDYLEAKKEFYASLDLNPFNPEAHNNLGIIFQKEGDLLKAEEELLKALEQNPSSEKIFNNLGLNSYLSGKWNQAISYYQSALKVNPRNLATYTNLSLLYKKLNDPTKAKEILERALSLNPQHPESLYNLAVILEAMGEKDKAIAYYEKFIYFAGPTYQGLVEKVKNHLKKLH